MAPRLDKETIDALVDGLPKDYSNTSQVVASNWVFADDLRRSLYLAAGLTADGERKPERVRGWMVRFTESSNLQWSDHLPSPKMPESYCTVTPGWFVPDGAE